MSVKAGYVPTSHTRWHVLRLKRRHSRKQNLLLNSLELRSPRGLCLLLLIDSSAVDSSLVSSCFLCWRFLPNRHSLLSSASSLQSYLNLDTNQSGKIVFGGSTGIVIVIALVGNLSLTISSPFAELLDGYGLSKSARNTCCVHAQIVKTWFFVEVFIQNRLINVYERCGCLVDARRVFDRMPEKNTFTWNAILGGLIRQSLDEAKKIFGSTSDLDQCSWNLMMLGYEQHEKFEEALQCFGKMHRENYVLHEYSFGSARVRQVSEYGFRPADSGFDIEVRVLI